jgi:hypothetical protein
MRKEMYKCALTLLASAALCPSFAQFAPGQRTLVLAHNMYPEAGKYTDRLDRALAAGTPLAIEIDLTWAPNPKTGQPFSLVGDFPERRFNEITGNEPILETQFFDAVRPLVEKALKSNDKRNWPLIRLYLDIKNDPPEHLEAIIGLLQKHQDWLTTAAKTSDATRQSPLDLKPMMVMLQDKDTDIKEEYFYNRVPVGGKILAFGTAKMALPPGQGLSDRQILQARAAMSPEELITEHASNYRRWVGIPWDTVEPGNKIDAGAWTPAKQARLDAFATQIHKMGYLVSFWNEDGADADTAKKMGWNAKYNFGSLEAATVRWKAMVQAGVDFIGTDQPEDVAKLLHSPGMRASR